MDNPTLLLPEDQLRRIDAELRELDKLAVDLLAGRVLPELPGGLLRGLNDLFEKSKILVRDRQDAGRLFAEIDAYRAYMTSERSRAVRASISAMLMDELESLRKQLESSAQFQPSYMLTQLRDRLISQGVDGDYLAQMEAQFDAAAPKSLADWRAAIKIEEHADEAA